jgi:DNA-binding protein HU-beta
MTKDELINEISRKTGIDKITVGKTVESLMETVKVNMTKNKDIYFKGFGKFMVKKRAKKTARNISKNTTVIIPEHFVPTFKPTKDFKSMIKSGKA